MIQWALFIDPQQIGEKPEEGGETLTVGELIELLQTCDNNAHVFFRYSNGEKFGIINEKMFLEAFMGIDKINGKIEKSSISEFATNNEKFCYKLNSCKNRKQIFDFLQCLSEQNLRQKEQSTASNVDLFPQDSEKHTAIDRILRMTEEEVNEFLCFLEELAELERSRDHA